MRQQLMAPNGRVLRQEGRPAKQPCFPSPPVSLVWEQAASRHPLPL